jgi:hypothetical protein
VIFIRGKYYKFLVSFIYFYKYNQRNCLSIIFLEENILSVVSDKMYSIANKPERCIECERNNNNDDGWFICQGLNLN